MRECVLYAGGRGGVHVVSARDWSSQSGAPDIRVHGERDELQVCALVNEAYSA